VAARRTPVAKVLAEVLAAVEAQPAGLGATWLVCVDGPAGSGKTTLAREIHEAVSDRGRNAATLHMDDLYEGWTGLTAAIEPRLLAQVLIPLSERRPARWQRYDWLEGRFAAWTDLDPPDVLVLEGCGSGSLAYAPWTSLLVWVEASPAVRLERGVERDGPLLLDHWLAWMELEEAYFATNRTRDRADLRLTTG
jgi:uridine kinase